VGLTKVRFVCLVGVGVEPVMGIRGAAGWHPPKARLRRALGRGNRGAARRGSSSVERQGLGAPVVAGSTGGKVQWRRRARQDVDGVHTGKGQHRPFL
jgi:hypothetical protein